ncbi:MAG: hypothetical protein ACI8TQ_003264 [Planctomycetota bacterium]|jgi:hypothetical protein
MGDGMIVRESAIPVPEYQTAYRQSKVIEAARERLKRAGLVLRGRTVLGVRVAVAGFGER